MGYNKKENQYYINRAKSGKTDFQNDFAAKHTAPRFAKEAAMNLSVIIDESSVELFADNGLSVMTEIFFPTKPYTHIQLQSADHIQFKKLEYIHLHSIWK